MRTLSLVYVSLFIVLVESRSNDYFALKSEHERLQYVISLLEKDEITVGTEVGKLKRIFGSEIELLGGQGDSYRVYFRDFVQPKNPVGAVARKGWYFQIEVKNNKVWAFYISDISKIAPYYQLRKNKE